MTNAANSGPIITRHTLDTPYPVGQVHIYTTEIKGKLILFDTGPPTMNAMMYLKRHVDLKKLDYVIITHCHPDHHGLAKFLQESSGAKVIVSRYDAFRFQRPSETLEAMLRIFRQMGFSAAETKRARSAIEFFEKSVPFAGEYLLLEEQDALMESLGIRWVRCPGHSQSDIIYLFDGVAITGDVLLREIYQAPLLDVDMETMRGRFCNYTAYCQTIPKLKAIENMKMHPSHREFVDSVDERITWYIGKMLDRAAAAAPILLGGCSIHDAVKRIFEGVEMEPFTLYVKISEVAFIHDFLEEPEKLAQAMKAAGLYDGLREKFEALY